MGKKKEFVREWNYKHFFSGDVVAYFPLEATREQVIRTLDAMHGYDNWQTSSLKRGKKRKNCDSLLQKLQ